MTALPRTPSTADVCFDAALERAKAREKETDDE